MKFAFAPLNSVTSHYSPRTQCNSVCLQSDTLSSVHESFLITTDQQMVYICFNNGKCLKYVYVCNYVHILFFLQMKSINHIQSVKGGATGGVYSLTVYFTKPLHCKPTALFTLLQNIQHYQDPCQDLIISTVLL